MYMHWSTSQSHANTWMGNNRCLCAPVTVASPEYTCTGLHQSVSICPPSDGHVSTAWDNLSECQPAHQWQQQSRDHHAPYISLLLQCRTDWLEIAHSVILLLQQGCSLWPASSIYSVSSTTQKDILKTRIRLWPGTSNCSVSSTIQKDILKTWIRLWPGTSNCSVSSTTQKATLKTENKTDQVQAIVQYHHPSKRTYWKQE